MLDTLRQIISIYATRPAQPSGAGTAANSFAK
jgi:hypothetical protein